MQLGAVTFVLTETIFGKVRAKVTHHSIARDLGDHARSRNRQAVAIAINDRRLRKWKRENRQTIDQDVIGCRRQCFEGGPHGLVRCSQDIDRIDLDRIDYADGPRHFGVGGKLIVNFLSQLGRELFRIVQLPVAEFFRKDDRGCDHRAS